MRVIAAGMIAAVACATAGCATGPSLQESQASVPELSAERARVFFYRTNSGFAWAVQPYVRLDGAVVGEAVPGGVFFCDVPPGHHIVAVNTEVNKLADLHLGAGETAYVKMDWGFGYIMARILLDVVPPETGRQEAANASLIPSQCPRA